MIVKNRFFSYMQLWKSIFHNRKCYSLFHYLACGTVGILLDDNVALGRSRYLLTIKVVGGYGSFSAIIYVADGVGIL